MKKTLIIGLLVMVILISGCTSAPTTPQPKQTQPAPTTTIQPTETPATTSTAQPTSAAVAVEIKGFAFNPLTITISKGTTVTWTNSDSAPHTVTSDSFDSGRLSQGQTFSHTFDQSGTFEYSCTIHPTIVHGKVIVT
jgi:plastocyanin